MSTSKCVLRTATRDWVSLSRPCYFLFLLFVGVPKAESGDACKALVRRGVLLLWAGGEVMEVVVFRRLSVVDSWVILEQGCQVCV